MFLTVVLLAPPLYNGLWLLAVTFKGVPLQCVMTYCMCKISRAPMILRIGCSWLHGNARCTCTVNVHYRNHVAQKILCELNIPV